MIALLLNVLLKLRRGLKAYKIASRTVRVTA